MNTRNICILSDVCYLILIIVLGIQFIKSNNIIWLVYIIYALGLITSIGYSIRDIFSYFGYSDPRPYLKEYSSFDKWTLSGMPSLHAMSTFTIVTLLILHDSVPPKWFICMISSIIVLLRVYCKVHSISQITIGSLLGCIFGMLIYNISHTSIYWSIGILLLSIIGSIIYILFKIIHRYTEVHSNREPLPEWFDHILLEYYNTQVSSINMSNFILQCYTPFIKNKTCLPIRLKWNQLESSISHSLPNTFHPDIIVGLYPNGVYFTKYIADHYNKPYIYIHLHSLLSEITKYKTNKILLVTDRTTPELSNIYTNTSNKNITL